MKKDLASNENRLETWDDIFPETSPADQPGSQKRTPQEEIYLKLREQICLLQHPPGTVLREGSIAKEFGISRTPIREVMHRLTFDGLVTAKNGVGYIVSSLDFEYYKDIYEVRIRLAENIGQLSPRDSTREDIDAASAILLEAEKLKSEFDLTEYWRLNRDLHNLIRGLIGNRALREMWDHLYFKVARIWFQLAPQMADEVAEDFYDEVKDVVRGLRDNNIEAIGYSQRNYISSGMKRVIQRMKAHKSGPGPAQS